MRNVIKGTVLLLGIGFGVSALAELEGTESYGVYLKSGDEYVPAQTIDAFSRLNFDATGHMFDFPVVEREDEHVELIVHYPDFHPGPFDMQVREMATAGAQNRVSVSVTPLDDDKYRIVTEEPVANDHIVLVDIACCISGVHGVALDDPRSVMLSAYDEGTDHNPNTAEHVVRRVADALPDDDEVTELHGYWETRVAQEEATRHYEFISGVWEQYEQAEEMDERINQLQRIQGLTETYLDDHPEGRERDEIREMHDKANDRLDV